MDIEVDVEVEKRVKRAVEKLVGERNLFDAYGEIEKLYVVA